MTLLYRYSDRAYPRRHGGNSTILRIDAELSGLSPQARGKPLEPPAFRHGEGPIPAGTGETNPVISRSNPSRAYPRRHGGNSAACPGTPDNGGLSPQARGKLGEKAKMIQVYRAYPRRHGGNRLEFIDSVFVEGLSPQARGKRPSKGRSCRPDGPIPAGTGETPRQSRLKALQGAYPRRHGGNNGMALIYSPIEGLSPQARGKPKVGKSGSGSAGPIPAGTGETPHIFIFIFVDWAYPRRHGGN